ncbi:MAG: hypothetical protein ACHQF4_02345 [Sphingobacteriales bacterium]
MENTEDYELYGKEWESEMKKWSKDLLIGKIRDLLIDKADLKDRYNDLLFDNCD